MSAVSDSERRRAVTADEADAYGGRRFYLWKPGQLRRIKRRTNKRERRAFAVGAGSLMDLSGRATARALRSLSRD